MIVSTTTALAAFSWLGVASAQYYAIAGVYDGISSNGSRPARLNINTLQKDSYAWFLIIEQATVYTSACGYAKHFAECSDLVLSNSRFADFAPPGIHGRPYYSWNNVDGQFGYTGYCTHESVLFPTWHRPYLALFEQEMNSHAQTIARQYYGPGKPKYMAAAKTLRMPYWDWAESAAIPTILNTAQITINTPTGKRQIDNPLYAYAFPPLDPTYFPDQGAYDSYLANDSTTLRDPNASANLMNAQLTPATYNLFTHTPVYKNFSTQAISGTSLEAVHGTVHVYVGGNYGHMTQLSYAAFDPIFWLHHCNVDRIFALWQAIYPDLFIPAEGLEDDYGTYTIAPGTTEYSTDPLTPFTSSTTGNMYTSDMSRDLTTWGYTYPEICDWNQTKAQLSATVTAKVNALYNPSSAYSRRKRHARDLPSTKQYEWFVDIEVSKSELQSSSMVLLFDGAPPTDTTNWRGASNLIGSLFVSMPPNHSMGGNKRYTHGEVPLKEALTNGGLSSSSKEAVITYLTDKLEWRVQNVDGTVVDLSSCPSLKIRVQDEEVTPPEDEHSFPTYGNPTAHPEITEGKVGGFEAADSE